MDFINKDNIAIILSILAAIVTTIGAIMNYKNQSNQIKNDEHKVANDGTKTIVEGAKTLIEPLTKRIDDMEKENDLYRDEVNKLRIENASLMERIKILERTILESPIYRIFFDLTQFSCLIIDCRDGKIFSANKAFYKMYGYTENDLKDMTIYNISLQEAETRNAIYKKSTYISDRLHRKKDGTAFLVEIYASYYDHEGIPFALTIYIPKMAANLITRTQSLLDQIVQTYHSDYATVWSIHNHGANKLSGIYEAVKPGNSYLYHDYRKLPATLFKDVFDYIVTNGYLLLAIEDDKYESARMSLKHSNLYAILFTPIMYNDELVGMLTTSWRGGKPFLGKEEITQFMKYSKSELLLEIVLNDMQNPID